MSRDRRQSAGPWIRKVAWLMVPLALVGELGHQLLERLGQDIVEHFDRTAQARLDATRAKLVGQSS